MGQAPAKRQGAGSAPSTLTNYLFQRLEHLDRRAAVDLEACPLFEIGDRRLALGSDVPVRVAANVITRASGAASAISFRPSRDNSGSSVGQGVSSASAATQAGRRTRRRRGCRIRRRCTSGINDVEIARHEKSRPLASRGYKQQSGVALAQRAPVVPGHAARRPEPTWIVWPCAPKGPNSHQAT